MESSVARAMKARDASSNSSGLHVDHRWDDEDDLVSDADVELQSAPGHHHLRPRDYAEHVPVHEIGLEKLCSTEEQARGMREELTALRPQLIQAGKETVETDKVTEEGCVQVASRLDEVQATTSLVSRVAKLYGARRRADYAFIPAGVLRGPEDQGVGGGVCGRWVRLCAHDHLATAA